MIIQFLELAIYFLPNFISEYSYGHTFDSFIFFSKLFTAISLFIIKECNTVKIVIVTPSIDSIIVISCVTIFRSFLSTI